MVVIVPMMVSASSWPPALPYQPHAQSDHQQPRAHLQHRNQDAGYDQLAVEECQKADGYNRGGVDKGDDPAQGERGFTGTRTPNEEAGDQGLSMTGGEGVQPA